MRPSARNAALWLLIVFSSVPLFGQSRSTWRTATDIVEGVRGTIVGTVADTEEATRRLYIASDDDRAGRILIVTDSISTQYNGFGGMINGQPEIFVGSTGFGNVRIGDRVEIRGVGRAGTSVSAEHVTLLGRTVAAPQTSVGTTRPPQSVTTPGTASAGAAEVWSGVEGVVRQVNASENRVVIETDRREMITVRTAARTPVMYEGRSYEVRNLEPGDRIRIETEGGATSAREVRARTITVVRSVQDGGGERGVGSVRGRISRIDRTNATMWVDDADRGNVRVDVARANDSAGYAVRLTDFRVGELVDVTGTYSGNVYVASTVRRGDEIGRDDIFADDRPPVLERPRGFETVTMTVTVVETLESSTALLVRERTGGTRTQEIWLTEDFVVRTKSGGYTTADRIRAGDQLIIRAYRDADGNLIAQTIRYR